MSHGRSGIKIWAPIIAAAAGEGPFTARDVPDIAPVTLRKLANFGYLAVLEKPHNVGRTYVPAKYRLLTNRKHVRDALDGAP